LEQEIGIEPEYAEVNERKESALRKCLAREGTEGGCWNRRRHQRTHVKKISEAQMKDVHQHFERLILSSSLTFFFTSRAGLWLLLKVAVHEWHSKRRGPVGLRRSRARRVRLQEGAPHQNPQVASSAHRPRPRRGGSRAPGGGTPGGRGGGGFVPGRLRAAVGSGAGGGFDRRAAGPGPARWHGRPPAGARKRDKGSNEGRKREGAGQVGGRRCMLPS
jgi:hypothetical protein